MPPPSPEAVELALRVVTPAWPHPVAAYDQALPLGQLPIAELLALAVHPPAAPEELRDLPAGWWERSVQTFAMLGVLHSAEPGRAHPTDTTAHRQLLTELAYGIEDWTTEAALYALVVAAWVDPTCRPVVAETVGSRFVTAVEAAQGRAVTILDSLAALALITPEMLPGVRSLAEDILAPAEPPAEPAPPPVEQEPAPKRSWLRRLLGR